MQYNTNCNSYLKYDLTGKTKILKEAKNGGSQIIEIVEEFVKEYKNNNGEYSPSSVVEEEHKKYSFKCEKIILFQTSLQNKKTILHYLAKHSTWEIIEAVMNRYPEEINFLFYERDRKMNLPIHYAAENEKYSAKIINRILKLYSDQKPATGGNGRNFYHFAAKTANFLFWDPQASS